MARIRKSVKKGETAYPHREHRSRKGRNHSLGGKNTRAIKNWVKKKNYEKIYDND